MAVFTPSILVVPGLGGSGPEHWQSLWQRDLADCRRVEQRDWDLPDRAGWIAALDRAVAESSRPPILVAHSLSCALVVHWAMETRRRIHGALLVAPADVDSDAHTPPEAHVFRPMPIARLPFPGIVVASSDDPYVGIERAAKFAKAWGSRFVDIGPAGHINASAGYGAWPEGKSLLNALLAESAIN